MALCPQVSQSTPGVFFSVFLLCRWVLWRCLHREKAFLKEALSKASAEVHAKTAELDRQRGEVRYSLGFLRNRPRPDVLLVACLAFWSQLRLKELPAEIVAISRSAVEKL